MSAVPAANRPWESHRDVFGDEAKRIAEATGVLSRPVVNADQCASDLCLAAADSLLEELAWPRSSVGLLIFLSQTPDFVLPATACLLQRRLGLSTGCAAFDVQLGCSGYPYALWLASHLLAGGAAERALVLVGDTISRLVSPTDRATAMLFGDAGSATALERDPSGRPMSFGLGSDGTGGQHLMVGAGGFRDDASARPTLFMDGAEVFAFAQSVVPRLVREVLAHSEESIESLDHVVFHQANTFMLRHLMKQLAIPVEKMVMAMDHFGNTSSASIPVAMSHGLGASLSSGPNKLLLCGFGVGWSWGAVVMDCGPFVAPPVLRV